MSVIVRSVGRNELGLYAAASGIEDDPVLFDRHAFRTRRAWARDGTKPEWTFVILLDGEPIGSTMYGSGTGTSVFPEIERWGYNLLPPYDQDEKLVEVLLRESLLQMREQGATTLKEAFGEFWTVEPYRQRFATRLRLFPYRHVGKTHRYELDLHANKRALKADANLPIGFNLRHLDGLEKPIPTIDLLRQVIQPSDIGALGPDYARIELGEVSVKLYEQIVREFWGWAVVCWAAYRGEDDLIGCVLFGNPDHETDAIYFVGVVPEKRRQGYGHLLTWLVAQYSQRMYFESVVCDVDSENTAMFNLLAKQDYKLLDIKWNYELDLYQL